MVRLAYISCFLLLLVSRSFGEADSDPRISRALAIQKAMSRAQEHLDARRPAEATALLEAEILYVNGDERFLALMKQAYVAYLKDLKQTASASGRVEHVRRQLRILDPNLNVDELLTKSEELHPPKEAAVEPSIKAVVKPATARPQIDEDPFQQPALDRMGVNDQRPRPRVAPEPKAPEPPYPEGWQAVESGSFRVFYKQNRSQATELGRAAEAMRVAIFEKWFGPPGNDWTPRCDIWLHPKADDYTTATRQPATSAGHASVGIKDGRIQNRRIDLRLDQPGFLETTLPREVAYVVIADLFPDQAVPCWAHVGMTILSQPAAEIARYRRALVPLSQEKKLFAIRDLLPMTGFPEAAQITPFYVESVTLVDYLVRLKGAKAFALYLREAPRRGYVEALERHYGIKDADELHGSWLKFAMKGE